MDGQRREGMKGGGRKERKQEKEGNTTAMKPRRKKRREGRQISGYTEKQFKIYLVKVCSEKIYIFTRSSNSSLEKNLELLLVNWTYFSYHGNLVSEFGLIWDLKIESQVFRESA